MSAPLSLTDVSKRFPQRSGRRRAADLLAVSDIDLDVAAGETVTLLGPSGCGKTTVLRLIAGLETPSTGSISVGGDSPGRARAAKQIGFVPQSPALLPWRTVGNNASLLLDVNGAKSPASPTMSVGELLDDVGLGEFVDAYPHELSGGMQQRVGLVRAFALDAPVLLLDEPFAALDEITRTEMRHLLGRLTRRIGTTIVFVTHSIAEATFLSDRVAVMTHRPGRVAEIVTVDLARPRGPEVEETAEFFATSTALRRALHAGGTT